MFFEMSRSKRGYARLVAISLTVAVFVTIVGLTLATQPIGNDVAFRVLLVITIISGWWLMTVELHKLYHFSRAYAGLLTIKPGQDYNGWIGEGDLGAMVSAYAGVAFLRLRIESGSGSEAVRIYVLHRDGSVESKIGSNGGYSYSIGGINPVEGVVKASAKPVNVYKIIHRVLSEAALVETQQNIQSE